jgi:hypothetical protein
MPFPKVRSHEKLLQLRGLAGCSRAAASQSRFHKAMTLREAKSITHHLVPTLRQVRYGKYRVNFRDGDETHGSLHGQSRRRRILRLRWPVSESCERRTVQSRSVI